MTKKVFITTAIDYTNAVIHVGQAYEKILADAIARHTRLVVGKDNTHFLTGTDEHGTTNQKAAEVRGIKPLEHVTDISQKDKQQIDALDISYDRFIRTTDEDHKKLALEFFKKAYDNGDIYKDKYEGFYCEGCESPKTHTELNEDGQCPIHPSRQIQKLAEENYFFRWSNYSDQLRELIESDKLEIKPAGKKAEMLAFLDAGLKDITISRPKEKVSWGITTPIDDSQVIYVWFDALINYLTEGLATAFWDADTQIIHFVGKDIARWHTLLWPAMLLSAGYRLPNIVHVHGFINLNGQKVSKSLGNVVYASELVDQFGTDATRYYLLKHGPNAEDTNISIDHLKEVYTADLSNGLGNTVSRLAKLCENSAFDFKPSGNGDLRGNGHARSLQRVEDFRVDLALQAIWAKLSEIDKHINENSPWAIKDDDAKLNEVLTFEVNALREVAEVLTPFMPQTAGKIQKQFAGLKIKAENALFPRLN